MTCNFTTSFVSRNDGSSRSSTMLHSGGALSDRPALSKTPKEGLWLPDRGPSGESRFAS